MTVIIYLYFTFLSILTQICIMQIMERRASNFNLSSQEQNVFESLIAKPHALFYKVGGHNVRQNLENSTPKYSNSSLPVTPFYDKKYYSTASTMYDVLFSENATTTDIVGLSESYTSTEYANVTELDVFPTFTTTTLSPKIKPKKTDSKENCFCDLLHNACDVNCCCDQECMLAEQQLFNSCLDEGIENDSKCYSLKSRFTNLNSLFCDVKNNLPQKRNTVSSTKEYNKGVESARNTMFSWHQHSGFQENNNFLGKAYAQGDPVWNLNGDIVAIMDLPFSQFNNYCTGRKVVKYLTDETNDCIVKLKDLEMFRIYKNFNKSKVVSVPHENWEASSMNCTNVYCTNWNIVICNEIRCGSYNKSIHEPVCTENHCTNVALKVEYVFYCHASNITNATIYMYVNNVSLNHPFYKQEMGVKFFLIHENVTEKVVKFSGNPGYLNGLPLIVSYVEENHTEHFLSSNNDIHSMKYPENIKSVCFQSNITYKTVNFKRNSRSKCNYFMSGISLQRNETENCKIIQDNILKLLGVNKKAFLSPLGNPSHITDDDWIELKHNILYNNTVYGKYNLEKSNLMCSNVATRLSYVFTCADTSDDTTKKRYRIFDAKAYLQTQDININIEEVFVSITVDTSFLDVTRPPIFEYAGAPQLNIYLPEDFLYPFAFSGGCCVRTNIVALSIALYSMK